MGNQASVPEKVYKAAKQNDVLTLKTLIRELYQDQPQGQSIQALRILEFKDGSSWTPLVVAAAKANYAAAELLLQHGANVHYVSNLPEASTALHEAVQRSHDGVVELLLRYGANAFLENGRGLTPIDLAINNRHVKLVRRLEQRSFFSGWLLMKVPKYMGLGSEWKSRWCVIMPRYPSPGAPRPEQVVRTLLVCYKGIDQAMPCCKVWLDGATARTVTGSRGSTLLQCMLALHRNHSPPTGAHVTGDAQSGFSLHIRPIDDTNAANGVLRRFMDVCGGNRQPQVAATVSGATPQRQPSTGAPQHQSSPAVPAPSGPPPLAQPPPSTAPSGRLTTAWGPPPPSRAEDEAYARQLQAQYDAENGRSSKAQPAERPAPPGIAAAPPRTSHAQPASSTQPSSLYHAPYPSLDGPLGQHMATNSAAPARNPTSSGDGGAMGYQPSHGPSFSSSSNPGSQQASYDGGWGSSGAGSDASAGSPSHRAPTGQASLASMHDDDSDMCVVCMEKPCAAGFVHGNSVHKCCCRECAEDYKRSGHPSCPICREPIEHIITKFY
ncbi:hypothetical protein WJX84_001116 [Apatococcus fuscideae]|uniref:RING-type domain-containing protein n=1 Tax=Apatococcus fuscideae TaxID=2026836 RepID=A0AAW1T462_9CHLO